MGRNRQIVRVAFVTIYKSEQNSKNKILIGFAVDMDRAYGLPREGHPKYPERKEHQRIFLKGMHRLINYFRHLDSLSGKSCGAAFKGVTWFVNEAAYKTSQFYPDLLGELALVGGEIGLHTHLNSRLFGTDSYRIDPNPNCWLQTGIIEPKQRLELFLQQIPRAVQQKVVSFKCGNHMRVPALFPCLERAGFKYDSTLVFQSSESRAVDGKYLVLFDDTEIKFGRSPWQIAGTQIWELPEIKLDSKYRNLRNHIEKTWAENPRQPVCIRLQLHPWQALCGDPTESKGVTGEHNLLQQYRDCLAICYSYTSQVEFADHSSMIQAISG